jgi:hypothetical protein
MMTAVLMEEEPLWEKNAGWILPVKLQAITPRSRGRLQYSGDLALLLLALRWRPLPAFAGRSVGPRRVIPLFDLIELGLLFRRQVRLDSDHKAELESLHLSLERQHFVELGQRFCLIGSLLFDQRAESLFLRAKLPLQFGELTHRLLGGCTNGRPLLFAQADGLLVAHDQLGWEKGLIETTPAARTTGSMICLRAAHRRTSHGLLGQCPSDKEEADNDSALGFHSV